MARGARWHEGPGGRGAEGAGAEGAMGPWHEGPVARHEGARVTENNPFHSSRQPGPDALVDVRCAAVS